MAHTPHELHDDFPEFNDRIVELKKSDAHFHNLAEKYHDLNRAVHRAETNIEPVEALAESQMRKERAALKDMLYKMLSE